MVTVIPTKEELTTPVNNGVTGVDSSDSQRLSQLIKDFQEVDFHRSASFKPLPEDIIHGQTSVKELISNLFLFKQILFRFKAHFLCKLMQLKMSRIMIECF
jgi:hypothetical protein